MAKPCELLVQRGEVMAAHGGERGRDGAGLVDVALDAIDAGLRDPALVVVRERRAILDALLVEQAEQQLADPGFCAHRKKLGTCSS